MRRPGTSSREAAAAMTDKDNEIYGICLRGKAGWGENMAFITADGQLLRRALVRRWTGSPSSTARVEGRAHLLRRPDAELRPAGRLDQRLQREPVAVPAGQVRHVDRRHGRRLLRDQPDEFDGRRQGRLRAGAEQGRRRQAGNWLWAWALAIPAGTQKEDAAKEFIEWATSKDYIELVAEKEGWANVPPGTPHLALREPEYQERLRSRR